MTDCELINVCTFFKHQMSKAPDMVEYQKKKYCKGDNTLCARHKVYKTLGHEKFPKDLFPIQIGKANQLIKKEMV
jgi:hypothetical protein